MGRRRVQIIHSTNSTSFDMQDNRPLPPGWIAQYDQNHQRTFWVDTQANGGKGRSIWTHPLDDPEYQSSQNGAPRYAPPPGPPENKSEYNQQYGQQQFQQQQPYGQQGYGQQGMMQQQQPQKR